MANFSLIKDKVVKKNQTIYELYQIYFDLISILYQLFQWYEHRQILMALNMTVQAISELEMNIVSAERVNEYTKLEPEVQKASLDIF